MLVRTTYASCSESTARCTTSQSRSITTRADRRDSPSSNSKTLGTLKTLFRVSIVPSSLVGKLNWNMVEDIAKHHLKCEHVMTNALVVVDAIATLATIGIVHVRAIAIVIATVIATVADATVIATATTAMIVDATATTIDDLAASDLWQSDLCSANSPTSCGWCYERFDEPIVQATYLLIFT